MLPNVVIALIVISITVVIYSQIGGRLSARQSLVWFLATIFLFFSALDPTIYNPLSHLFGFQLLSNFILSSLILFLFLQALSQQAETTRNSSKLREMVASIASLGLCEKLYKSFGRQEAIKALVLVPCYNEEAIIEQTIDRLKQVCESSTHPNLSISFCIIDDGSQDSTAIKLLKHCPGNFVSHSCNIGVSGVLLTGFKAASSLEIDYVVQCDADGQHPVEEILSMIEESAKNQVDLLIGSRYSNSYDRKRSIESTNRLRWSGSQTIVMMLRMFGKRADIKDPTSGFRVYSKRAYQELIRHMPEEYPEPESIAILTLRNFLLQERNVKMLPRVTGQSSLTGLKSIRYMVKVLSALIGLRLRSFP